MTKSASAAIMQPQTSHSVRASDEFAPSALQDSWVQGLIETCKAVQSRAIGEEDLESAESVSELILALMQLRQLQNYFHRSPSRAIDGEGGVAKRLGITRNAVYKRLKMLGLDVQAFRVPRSYRELVESSRKMLDMIDDVETRAARFGIRAKSRKPR